jgi:hypothetical protein
MKLEDAEILLRYPAPSSAGLTIARNGSRVALTYNVPGSGKLRLSIRPDNLEICDWVSSLGGNYLFNTGSIEISEITIELLTRGIMPEKI